MSLFSQKQLQPTHSAPRGGVSSGAPSAVLHTRLRPLLAGVLRGTRMHRSQQDTNGFTVLELIVAIVLLATIGTVFFIQERDLGASRRDEARKTAINAIYYNLEYVYYSANKAYPEHLTADGLKGLDPSKLKDPNDVAVGEEGSEYRYTPKDCAEGKCKSYELRADLEKEGDFTKNSLNN